MNQFQWLRIESSLKNLKEESLHIKLHNNVGTKYFVRGYPVKGRKEDYEPDEEKQKVVPEDKKVKPPPYSCPSSDVSSQEGSRNILILRIYLSWQVFGRSFFLFF